MLGPPPAGAEEEKGRNKTRNKGKKEIGVIELKKKRRKYKKENKKDIEPVEREEEILELENKIKRRIYKREQKRYWIERKIWKENNKNKVGKRGKKRKKVK